MRLRLKSIYLRMQERVLEKAQQVVYKETLSATTDMKDSVSRMRTRYMHICNIASILRMLSTRRRSVLAQSFERLKLNVCNYSPCESPFGNDRFTVSVLIHRIHQPYLGTCTLLRWTTTDSKGCCYGSKGVHLETNSFVNIISTSRRLTIPLKHILSPGISITDIYIILNRCRRELIVVGLDVCSYSSFRASFRFLSFDLDKNKTNHQLKEPGFYQKI